MGAILKTTRGKYIKTVVSQAADRKRILKWRQNRRRKRPISCLQRVEERFQVSEPGKLLHQVVAVAPPQRPKRIITTVEDGDVYKLLLPRLYRYRKY